MSTVTFRHNGEDEKIIVTVKNGEVITSVQEIGFKEELTVDFAEDVSVILSKPEPAPVEALRGM